MKREREALAGVQLLTSAQTWLCNMFCEKSVLVFEESVFQCSKVLKVSKFFVSGVLINLCGFVCYYVACRRTCQSAI